MVSVYQTLMQDRRVQIVAPVVATGVVSIIFAFGKIFDLLVELNTLVIGCDYLVFLILIFSLSFDGLILFPVFNFIRFLLRLLIRGIYLLLFFIVRLRHHLLLLIVFLILTL